MSKTEQLLSLGAKTSTKASKPKMPQIDCPQDKVDILRRLAVSKAEMKRAESEYEDTRKVLEPWARESLRTQSVQDGELHTSIRILSETDNVRYTKPVAFCSIQADQCRDRLMELFGVDYDQFFSETSELTVDVSELNESEASQMFKMFIKTFGEERAKRILKSKNVVKPNEHFAMEMTFNVGTRRVADIAESEGLIRPKAGAFYV